MNTNLSPLHAIKSVPVSRNLGGIDASYKPVLAVGHDEPRQFETTLSQPERAPRKVTFGCIAIVMLAVVFAWLTVTIHQNAFAKGTATQQASSTFDRAMAAWHTGDTAKADRLLADSYTQYAASGYPASKLAEISSTRAQINAAMNNTMRAQQLSKQAHEFAANAIR